MLKTLTIFILELILLFGCFAFTEASFNIKEWHQVTRITFVFYAMVFLILDLAFTLKVEEN